MKKGRTVLQAKRLGIVVCKESVSLLEAAQRMVDEDVSALVVIDEQNDLIGIISRTDLLRAYCENEAWSSILVKHYMNRDVVTIRPSDLLSSAAKLLLINQIHRVVVVDGEMGKRRPVAVVSAADLVYHMVKDA
jgi:CBS domain-containing protein